MQRQIGLLVETSQQPAALARQKIGPLAAHRSGGWAARRTCPLGPFHHARDADIETHRHCPARKAPQNCRHNAPKQNQKGSSSLSEAQPDTYSLTIENNSVYGITNIFIRPSSLTKRRQGILDST